MYSNDMTLPATAALNKTGSDYHYLGYLPQVIGRNGTNKFCMLCFQGKNFQAASKKAEPSRLVMLKHGDNDRFSGGVILADGVVVECLDTDGVLGMVLQLLYAYCAWDLTYPKRYQLLGFIQQYVIKDVANMSTFQKCTNFKNFETMFNVAKEAKGSSQSLDASE